MQLVNEMKSKNTEVATLAGGCFWCMEAIFNEVKGVIKVVPGYSGGTVSNPSYEEVCTGKTGHAETVMVTYDPSVISFTEILEVFFSTHDPTSINRQGNDIGTQYASVIFYMDEYQESAAKDTIRKFEEEKRFPKPIATRVERFSNFYPAEDYHKNYFLNNPEAPYCTFVISPKIEKFRKSHASFLINQKYS
jgi:peptide-methionine (S)-S-oxide reductase